MRFPFAIGAVVGVPTTFHTPLSGQLLPVRAGVPMRGVRLHGADRAQMAGNRRCVGVPDRGTRADAP
jgi:hypothetical protein